MRAATLVAAVLILLAGPPARAGEGDEDLADVVRELREEVRTLRNRVNELTARDGIDEVLGYESDGLDHAIEVASGPNVYAPKMRRLTIGGQVRSRFENQHDFDFDDQSSTSSEFVLLRTRLTFGAEIAEDLSAVVQIQDTRFFGSEGMPTADLEGVDLKLGHVDFAGPLGLPGRLRIGRQELVFGAQRLVSTLDWHGYGRAWDGFRFTHEGDGVTADLFVTRIDEDLLAGGGDENEDFLGLYTSFDVSDGASADAYLLYRRNQDADEIVAEDGDGGHEQVYTLGGLLEGSFDGFGYFVEGDWQFGDFAGDDVGAFALEVGVSRGFELAGLDPKVTLAWTWASGDDDPGDGDRTTFDPLYPFGHFYLGFMDRVGRRNLNSPRIEIDTTPAPGWTVSLDYHMFWLDTSRDALYNAGGAGYRKATGPADDYVGSEIDLHFRTKVSERVALWGGYSHFFAGRYLGQTGSGDDADWVFLQMTVDF